MAAQDQLERQAPLRHPAVAWMENPVAFSALVPVLTLAGAGTTLLAPMLLDPVAFGAFALLSILFQYTAAADLGLSQLADRLAARRTDNAAAILRARWRMSLLIAGVGAPAAAGFAWWSGSLPVVATGLAILAGAAFMAANGPVSIHRAAARIGRFTLAALVLQFGMTLPRLAGLSLGGVTGCFAALALWYVGVALLLARPPRGPTASVGSLLGESLPLFAFYGAWLLFISATRWISWFVSRTETDFGLFAFGAGFLLVGVGVVSNISQVRYPRIVAQVAVSPAAGARLLAGDLTRLALATALCVAAAIPLADHVVGRLFPRYVAATPSALALATSAIPLAMVAWSLPVSISLSRHPWRDALAVFALPLALLGPAMWLGERFDGLRGQAWACAFVSALLAGLQLDRLRRAGALTLPGAGRCLTLMGGLSLALWATISVATANERTPYQKPPASALAFEDSFSDLRLWNGKSGVWQPSLPWGGRTIPTNRERQFYVDARIDPPSIARLAPFSLDSGLVITARPIPADARALTAGLSYASGLLTTARSFSQTYGYFEIRAKVPRGRGLWPAFWLAPADRSWPPEIDVMEAHGHLVDGYWATIHWREAGGAPQEQGFRISTPDLSEDFHDYGVEWGPELILWTFDGEVVARAQTPQSMRKPMYMLVNLAVGGKWPGDPDSTTTFPATFHVQRVQAYRLDATTETSR